MFIKRVPIGQVRLWEKNPRAISEKDYARLKKMITELSTIVAGQPQHSKSKKAAAALAVEVFKPLVVCKDGPDKYTVLGGNMRLRAFRDLGQKEVDISIVHPRTETEKLKIALADNDRAGYVVDQTLAEMLAALGDDPDLDLDLFKVDLQEPTIDLRKVKEFFGPAGDFARPDFAGIIDQFEPDRVAHEDECWLYAEYYGQAPRFKKLQAALAKAGVIKGAHQLDPAFLEAALRAQLAKGWKPRPTTKPAKAMKRGPLRPGKSKKPS